MSIEMLLIFMWPVEAKVKLKAGFNKVNYIQLILWEATLVYLSSQEKFESLDFFFLTLLMDIERNLGRNHGKFKKRK